MEIISVFNVKITIPKINNPKDIMNILESVDCKTSEKEKIVGMIHDIPIKQFLLILDMAKQMSNGELTFDSFSVAFDYFSNSY